MRPILIPEEIKGQRVIIGDSGNPADEGAPMPCEYVVEPSPTYPGRPMLRALVLLEPADMERINSGARHLWLTFDGAEVPWSLEVAW